MELSEDHFHAITQTRGDEAVVATVMQALESTVSEAPHHFIMKQFVK